MTSSAPQQPALTVRSLLASNAWAMIVAAAATLAIEIGAHRTALAAGRSPPDAVLCALAAAVAWVILSSAPLAAGANGAWSSILRGAVPADASCLALLVIALLPAGEAPQARCMTVLAALKAYCTLAAVGLFSIAAVNLSRTRPGRLAAAIIVVGLLMAILASPFWIAGPAAAIPSAADSLVRWSVWVNPFDGVTAATSGQTHFLWRQWGLMYERFATYSPSPSPPVEWYTSAVACGLMAFLLAACGLFRRGN